jgi:hypothetical protein
VVPAPPWELGLDWAAASRQRLAHRSAPSSAAPTPHSLASSQADVSTLRRRRDAHQGVQALLRTVALRSRLVIYCILQRATWGDCANRSPCRQRGNRNPAAAYWERR